MNTDAFKLFLLSQSGATDRPQEILEIKSLLLDYANFIYAAMQAYIDMANQNRQKDGAPNVHKADYFLNLAAETIKEARRKPPDNVL